MKFRVIPSSQKELLELILFVISTFHELVGKYWQSHQKHGFPAGLRCLVILPALTSHCLVIYCFHKRQKLSLILLYCSVKSQIIYSRRNLSQRRHCEVIRVLALLPLTQRGSGSDAEWQALASTLPARPDPRARGLVRPKPCPVVMSSALPSRCGQV